jgi:hypothetical protein
LRLRASRGREWKPESSPAFEIGLCPVISIEGTRFTEETARPTSDAIHSLIFPLQRID